MSDLNTRCLDAFPAWLGALPEDARVLASALSETGAPEAARVALAGALNYLFKSIDLIADGIEDLGYVDDAFVLRVAVEQAGAEAFAGLEQQPALARLAQDAELVSELLGSDYPRLVEYVAGLSALSVRDRSAQQIAGDAEVRAEFLHDLQAWAESYQAPGFSRDEKNLVKLRAFLRTKLSA